MQEIGVGTTQTCNQQGILTNEETKKRKGEKKTQPTNQTNNIFQQRDESSRCFLLFPTFPFPPTLLALVRAIFLKKILTAA